MRNDKAQAVFFTNNGIRDKGIRELGHKDISCRGYKDMRI